MPHLNSADADGPVSNRQNLVLLFGKDVIRKGEFPMKDLMQTMWDEVGQRGRRSGEVPLNWSRSSAMVKPT